MQVNAVNGFKLFYHRQLALIGDNLACGHTDYFLRIFCVFIYTAMIWDLRRLVTENQVIYIYIIMLPIVISTTNLGLDCELS